MVKVNAPWTREVFAPFDPRPGSCTVGVISSVGEPRFAKLCRQPPRLCRAHPSAIVIDTAECLALAADYRHDATGWHEQRVGRMAARLSEALGHTGEETALICREARCTMSEKIGISDDILRKSDKLTPEEFEVIKTHTTIGAKILTRHTTALLKLAGKIVLTTTSAGMAADTPGIFPARKSLDADVS